MTMIARTTKTALVMTLGVLALTACPKKQEAAVDASVPDAAVVVLVSPDQDAAVAPFEAGAATPVPVIGAKPATPTSTTTPTAPPAAEPVASASAAPAVPGPGECCCEIAGQPLASLGQSECTKAKHGKCVKKDRCADATLRPAEGTGTCCCKAGAELSVRAQSECTRGGHGQCVKMAECKAR
jgi:hypothetical protein